MAVICAVLSSNVEGGQRAVLLVLTVAWLVIAATCVANALRTAAATDAPADEPVSEPTGESHDAT